MSPVHTFHTPFNGVCTTRSNLGIDAARRACYIAATKWVVSKLRYMCVRHSRLEWEPAIEVGLWVKLNGGRGLE